MRPCRTRPTSPLDFAQREDGGWSFSWPAWSPVAEAEWRGSVTVGALLVLRANGRLEA